MADEPSAVVFEAGTIHEMLPLAFLWMDII